MVRIRHYDKDTPFGSWLRDMGAAGHLPSNAVELGIIASDVDMVVQSWKNHYTGKTIKAVFWLEVKTRMGDVPFAQDSIFCTMNQFACQHSVSSQLFRFYGIMRLIMSGTSPYDSHTMLWQRWPWQKDRPKKILTRHSLKTDVITASQLVAILRMDTHPTTLKKWCPDKSHHGTTVKTEFVDTPLFGPVEKPYDSHY